MFIEIILLKCTKATILNGNQRFVSLQNFWDMNKMNLKTLLMIAIEVK